MRLDTKLRFILVNETKKILERIYCFFACLVFSLVPTDTRSTSMQTPSIVHTVVIDAGHGGKDAGARGRKHKEKDVALSIALQLGRYIKNFFPKVRVIYTRSDDTFIPLDTRAEVANNAHASLFISIHCNATLNQKRYVKGTETYVLGLERNKENLAIAKRENAVIQLERGFKEKYKTKKKSSAEEHIMLSMYQNAALQHSLRFAEQVEQEFVHKARRYSRGVKQAGFLVLRKTTMPSVLVEVGFLTNIHEERFLGSTKGQAYIASSIYRAFKHYKSQIEGVSYQPEAANFVQTQAAYSLIEDDLSARKGIDFLVELEVYPHAVSTRDTRWRSLDQLFVDRTPRAYRYLTGPFTDILEAQEAATYYKAEGFPRAYVTAYRDGKRIPLKLAQQIIATK